MSETPTYIKSLVTPNGKKPAGRRVWSIDLQSIWLPFFTATNTLKDTQLPPDALGCPIRLGYNIDGSVKFSKTGRVVTKVAKPLSDIIRVVRDNFTAGLMDFAEQVQAKNKAGYQRQIDMAVKTGMPIHARDKDNMERAIAQATAEAMAKAEAEAEALTKAEAKAEAEAPQKQADKELVTA